MADHNWVKMTLTKVDVKKDTDPEGDLVISEDSFETIAGEETAVYGCSECEISLDEGFGTPCPGKATEEVSP